MVKTGMYLIVFSGPFNLMNTEGLSLITVWPRIAIPCTVHAVAIVSSSYFYFTVLLVKFFFSDSLIFGIVTCPKTDF